MRDFLKLKYKVESIMIISLPFFMIFSRFILEFFLLIISTSFLIKVIRKKEYRVFYNNFFIFFLGIYFILLLSFVFSEVKEDTLSILFYFRYGLYVFAIYYFLKEEENLINYFLQTVTIIILILFFDSLIQYFFGYNLAGFKNAEVHRITSFFGNEQILGSYVVKLFPFLLLHRHLTNERYKKTNYITILAIFVAPIIVFLSGERTSIVLFFLMLVYFLIFFIKSKKFRFIYFYVVFVIFTIGTLLYNSNVYYDRYVNQTLESLFDKDGGGNRHFLPEEYFKKNNFYILSAQHQNLIYTGMKIFKENKFLGTGPKSYRYICADDNYKINFLSCNTHSHNYYLQALIETGSLGFMFLLLTYFYIAYRSVKNFIKILRNQNYNLSEVIILGFYITQLWPLMQHGSLFNNWVSIVLFLPMSFFLFIKEKKNEI